MADVTGAAAGRKDRGQMLLVAAFGLALMLVTMALILNTSIYTENLATRGSDISGGKDAARYRAVTEDTLAYTIEYVNENNNTTSGYDELEDPAKWAVWNYTNMTGNQQALNTIVANISLQRLSEGTHVFQQFDRNFSNRQGDADWTVTSSARGVRKFTINATDDMNATDVGAAKTSSALFFVHFDSASEEYRIYVYENEDDATEFVVQVDDGSGTTLGTCVRSYETLGGENRARINLTNASVARQHCEPLEEWWSIVDDDFRMDFKNVCYNPGNANILDCPDSAADPTIVGQFSFVVNDSIGSVNVQPGTDGNSNPDAATAIYSMTVHLTYESKRLYYETDVRSAPGEPDA